MENKTTAIYSKKYLLQSLLLGSAKKLVTGLKGAMWINNQCSNQVSFVFAVPVGKTAIGVS